MISRFNDAVWDSSWNTFQTVNCSLSFHIFLTWSLFSQHCVPLVRSGAVHTIGTLISLEREKEGYFSNEINQLGPSSACSKFQISTWSSFHCESQDWIRFLSTGNRGEGEIIANFLSFHFFNFLFTRLASFFARENFVISTFPLSLFHFHFHKIDPTFCHFGEEGNHCKEQSSSFLPLFSNLYLIFLGKG